MDSPIVGNKSRLGDEGKFAWFSPIYILFAFLFHTWIHKREYTI